MAELEAMFCRAGKILDSFIPIDKKSGIKSGFGFVRFESLQEAEMAVEQARGRSFCVCKQSIAARLEEK